MTTAYVLKDGIDIGSLLSAYEQFHEGLNKAQSDLEKAGVIKLFEITFELSWKTMKRIIAARGKEANSPKQVIREAALEKLIEGPEVWFTFIDERNETVHTYNRKVANSIFAELHKFDKEVSAFIERIKKLK
jgi:nucleotidyltransferase substrate binding protein (TIGR01987 family)